MERKDLLDIPQLPGVYLFKDKKGTPLYVGKAVNLKSRVLSYFASGNLLGPKTKIMVQRAVKLDFIKVDSEIESLLLEADLIRQFKPKYNISLKDDKKYPLIEIYGEKRDNKIFKGIRISRTKRSMTSKYFGPFPDGNTPREVLKILRRAYPYADCSKNKFYLYQKLIRPCLYGKISLCPAPCLKENFDKNAQNIYKIRNLLKSGKTPLTKKMEGDMATASREERFEDAAKIRDLLSRIQYLSQTFTPPVEFIKNPGLESDTRQKELKELKTILNLPKIPNRIEFFDISNISGKHATGSMIVLIKGTPKKDLYKRFKIKTKDSPDDFAMIAEVIKRRFSHNDWDYPDLVVVDGGLGQLSSTVFAFNNIPNYSNISKIPFIGLAKKHEIVIKSNGDQIKLLGTHPALKLLIRGRDEAHRFAKAYFTKLLLKSATSS